MVAVEGCAAPADEAGGVFRGGSLRAGHAWAVVSLSAMTIGSDTGRPKRVPVRSGRRSGTPCYTKGSTTPCSA